MALKPVRITVSEKEEGMRLDQALADLLPAAAGMPLSKGKIRKLIIAGAVYMNRGRIRIASKAVRKGMRIEVMIDPAKLLSESERSGDGGRPREWKLSDIEIIFEDEWLIGLNKPAGLPTQPTLDEARANLYALLKKFVEARAKERGEKEVPYIGLHHRLDRDTSGVMLFTKRKEANAGVGKLFQEHHAQKTYLAIVSGKSLPKTWTVENFLARESGKAGKMRSVRSGGDSARTVFRCLSQVGKYALVEAKPLTGRMHQIRVHLSEGGTPILGDVTYGGECDSATTGATRVMLHAVALTFPHPISKLETSLRAPVPADFEKCLKLLHLDSSSADS